MPTSFPISLPHAPTGFVDQAALDTAFTVPINDLAAQVSGQYYGDNTVATSTTLATAATNFAATSAVTFTLTSTRRVRIYVNSLFSMASGTSGRYAAVACYNTGATATIGSGTTVGRSGIVVLTITSTAGSASACSEGTVLLTAGTYTAYPAIQRVSGGSATDTGGTNYVAVYDVGGT